MPPAENSFPQGQPQLKKQDLSKLVIISILFLKTVCLLKNHNNLLHLLS